MLSSQNKKVSLFLIVLGVVFVIMSVRLPKYPLVPVDADAVPIILGCLLIFLSILLFFIKDEPKDGEDSGQSEPFFNADRKMILLFGGLILLYIIFLEWLGFLLTTALFIFTSTFALGYKKHVTNIVVAIAIPIAFYYLFNYVLKISLPKGILPF
ncbi:tripartite tricarboxylate transporter TctB family protein [Sporosarcina highlanderae]|uniref:Tripartite tricarboxylate transporter TctB family protein n=1 Tax=Sporosarcina highlanderae TaxID=3035916 RepID=A0ABT8JVI4_9BACL|nr:tripartite tricarboxylate transporter TctB family protein [Sporosarcina highlanderae]MDN4609190.1 tripartite tricarboxylate transporter TctB family protein [Sporosarcina highlanderae]